MGQSASIYEYLLHDHKNVHPRQIYNVKMVQSASSQSVGRSPGGSGRSAAAPRGSGATVRQRKAAPTRKAAPGGGSGQGGGTMWRFYSEDSPVLKLDQFQFSSLVCFSLPPFL